MDYNLIYPLSYRSKSGKILKVSAFKIVCFNLFKVFKLRKEKIIISVDFYFYFFCNELIVTDVLGRKYYTFTPHQQALAHTWGISVLGKACWMLSVMSTHLTTVNG